MPKLTVYTTGKLTATTDPRVKEGLLLPFGVPGRTNKGKLQASAGTLQIADQLDPLTLEHDPRQPIATFETIEETASGLKCSVRYLPTRAGDDALAELEAGARTGLSVEIDDLARTDTGPTIRGGKIVAGLVTGGSQVVAPAFAAGRLAASDDTDIPDQGDDEPTDNAPTVVIDGTELPGVTDVTITDDQINITTDQTDNATDQTEETAPMTASKPPARAKLQATNLRRPAGGKLQASAADLFAMLAGAQSDGKLLAALADIVPANILAVGQPQYVGELWSGKAYQRKIIPLFGHGDLTNLKVQGWRWLTKPVVDLYSGNKTGVPSGAINTEPVEITAQRIAGAHDIDRAIFDFGNAEFWSAYADAMTESYARVSDTFVLGKVKDQAPYVAPGTVPASVAKGMAYIVDGALAILNATDTMPDSAVVSTDLWRELMLTRSEDALAYLSAALGLEDGTAIHFAIKPSAALADDTVLVSCKPAVTVHELGGEAPIRVDAIDMAKGGLDKGVFGYVAVNVHDEDGLALVSGTEPDDEG